MNLSYWEYKTWFHNIDYAIIGSGIVGLSCALSLRERHPNAKIVVFESGTLPNGASTKNAGFACFGSLSEIIEDLKTHSEDEVVELVRKRVMGLEILRKNLGDKKIDFQRHGGYELFTLEDEALYENCLSKLSYINSVLKKALFNEKDVFSVKNDAFSFKKVQKMLIFNQFEGQLDTGKMMHALIQKCVKKGVFVLNSFKIESFLSKNDQIVMNFKDFGEISAKKLCIATNGFANQLINTQDLKPARAQVLITKPIRNLHIKGTFHLDRGYYYFRNIDDRILLGGGRNLDFTGETTTSLEVTSLIQNKLEDLLHTTIIPNTPFEVEHRWSGIMGVGSQKKPIVMKVDDHVYCGVRLGGMGVAIGSLVGSELATIAQT
ncbi:MAG: FAD-dependent oxidoreductase [Flavobacteriaceae bacterium]|nr:FAD-dependent oxidoreductase [Flavobacteriaceae bacterium]